MTRIIINTAADIATLRAVALNQSDERTRYYLHGVYFEPQPDGQLRMTATDGHTLVTAQITCDHDLTEPVIVPVPNNASLKKAAVITWDGTKWTYTDKRGNASLYPATPIDATYPDYPRVIPKRDALGNPRAQTVFLPAVLGKITDVALALGNPGIDIVGTGSNDPALVLFSGRRDIMMVAMPCSCDPDQYGYANFLPGDDICGDTAESSE